MADRTFQDPSRAFLSVMDPAYREPSRAALMLRGLLANILSPIDMSIETYNMLRGDGGRTRTATERVAPALGLPTSREFTPDQAAVEFGSAVGDVSPLFMMGLAGAAPSAGTRAIPNQRGAIDVSHGSPHTFDRFDFSKIGTGEGAQSYGYGGYVAEGFNSPVARSYQNTLSRYGELHLADGSVVSVPDLPYNSPQQIAGEIWLSAPNLQDAKFKLKNLDSKYLGAPKDVVEKELEKLSDKGAALSGNLYNARMAWPDAAREAADPLGPQHFLDWDKPLSEQSKAVQDSVLSYWKENRVYGDPMKMTGEGIHGSAQAASLPGAGVGPINMNAAKEAAAMDLRRHGLIGIRYLDQGSRGAGTGTSNYVVFPGNEDMLTILERNGISLLNPQK